MNIYSFGSGLESLHQQWYAEQVCQKSDCTLRQSVAAATG